MQFEWNMHACCINFAPYQPIHKAYLYLGTNKSMKLTEQKIDSDSIKCTINKV